MALYRRFAIYFYQYQGARKGAFAGFGMVELRDGRMRMQITGRGSYQNAQLEVYGLLDGSEEMAGIHLGTMQSGHFSYERSMQLHPEKSFQQLRGIVLCQKPGADRVAAALWAGNFHTGTFYTWTPRAEQIQTESGKSIKEAELETAELGVCEIQDEVAEADEPICAQKESEPDAEEEHVVQEESEPDVEEEHVVQGESEPDVEEEHIVQEESEPDVEEEHVVREEKEQKVEIEIRNKEENKQKVENTERNWQNQEEKVGSKGKTACIDAKQETCEQKHNAEYNSEDDFWEQMYQQFPKMMLQIDGTPISALRIRPCDISRLPKTDWSRGCSQFLARQYNQYRCMILGREQKGERWQYFLGMPGSHTPSERQDATEAGFTDFVQVHCPIHQQIEGFWIYDLDFQK